MRNRYAAIGPRAPIDVVHLRSVGWVECDVGNWSPIDVKGLEGAFGRLTIQAKVSIAMVQLRRIIVRGFTFFRILIVTK